MKIQKAAAPELVAAVKSGEVSISAAAVIADLPAEEQAAAAAGGKKELRQAAKRVRDSKVGKKAAGDAVAEAAVAVLDVPVNEDGELEQDPAVALLRAQVKALQEENVALRAQVDGRRVEPAGRAAERGRGALDRRRGGLAGGTRAARADPGGCRQDPAGTPRAVAAGACRGRRCRALRRGACRLQRGIAAGLVHATVDALRAAGCVEASLEVAAGNATARALYAHCGFAPRDRYRLMSRRLAPKDPGLPDS